jgi:hypothetical protein
MPRIHLSGIASGSRRQVKFAFATDSIGYRSTFAVATPESRTAHCGSRETLTITPLTADLSAFSGPLFQARITKNGYASRIQRELSVVKTAWRRRRDSITVVTRKSLRNLQFGDNTLCLCGL